jgi:hypothetical protein
LSSWWAYLVSFEGLARAESKGWRGSGGGIGM